LHQNMCSEAFLVPNLINFLFKMSEMVFFSGIDLKNSPSSKG